MNYWGKKMLENRIRHYINCQNNTLFEEVILKAISYHMEKDEPEIAMEYLEEYFVKKYFQLSEDLNLM